MMSPSSWDHRNPDSVGSKSLSYLDYQHESNTSNRRPQQQRGGGTTGDPNMDRILELNKPPQSKQKQQNNVRGKPSPNQLPKQHQPPMRRQVRRASDTLLENIRNSTLQQHEKHMKHTSSDPNMRNKHALNDSGHGYATSQRRMEMETLQENSAVKPKSDLDFLHERQHYGGRHQSHLPLVRDLPDGRKRLVSFHPNTIHYTKDLGMDNSNRSPRNIKGGAPSQRGHGDASFSSKNGTGGHRWPISSSTGATSGGGMDVSGRTSRNNIGANGVKDPSMNGSGHRRPSGVIPSSSGGMDGSGRLNRNLLGGPGDRPTRSNTNNRGNELSSSGHGRPHSRQSIKKRPQNQQVTAINSTNNVPGQPLPRSVTSNAPQPENHLKNTAPVPKISKVSSVGGGLTKMFGRKKKDASGEMRQTELRLAAATAAFASLNQ
mmetsp:Transcript_20925/g.29536  ORF Transcript_20925/g.29536 Transcript_20925/m.29536 type:complete len:432 (+) Transcript_20925:214-1509(+)